MTAWAALTSGGKDSVLSIQKAIDAGLDVQYIVAVRSENLDSYMFHSANIDVVKTIAEVSGREYVEIKTHGRKEEELADLEQGLAALPIEGIIAGAVASVYQRDRVAAIAERLMLKVFTPLWGMDPEQIISEVASRMDAMIIVTAADGLDGGFLGAHFDQHLIDRLKQVSARRGIHLAGEGGEYESLTLNAPFYTRPITYTSSEVHTSAGRSELVLRGFT